MGVWYRKLICLILTFNQSWTSLEMKMKKNYQSALRKRALSQSIVRARLICGFPRHELETCWNHSAGGRNIFPKLKTCSHNLSLNAERYKYK